MRRNTPRRRSDCRDVYDAIADPGRRVGAVARALDILERDPLASAGAFPGDLVRRLIDLPAGFWREHPALDARYRDAVRAAALARRAADAAARRGFWRDLPERLGP
jgi:hypothetical protein